MHVLPRSRRGRVTAGVLLVALLGAVWVRWDDVVFVAKLAVPGPAYSAANDRTSEPAAEGADVELPRTVDAERPTGTDPGLTLGPGIPLPGASALAAASGSGPVLVTTLDGRVHSVDLDAGTTDVVLDISDRITTGGERELLGIAIDPEGERMYLDFTDAGAHGRGHPAHPPRLRSPQSSSRKRSPAVAPPSTDHSAPVT